MNLISDRAILASGMLFECFLRHFKSFEQKIFDFRSSGCKLPRYRELCARCNHCCLHYKFDFKTSPWRSPSFDRSTLSFSTSRKYYMSTPRTNKDIHWLYAERKYELLFINNNKKRNHILWSCKWTHSPPSLRQSPYLLPSVALELNKTGLSFLIAFQWLNSNRYMGEILK